MNLLSFLKLVEIQTKVASVIPFFLGTVYAVYRFHSFNPLNFILMFISLISLDMAVTAINNYHDYKKAYIREGYNYETHNAIVRDKLEERKVKAAILSLVLIFIITGLLLFLHTNFIILVLGGISFLIGVLYSSGPVPISRTPLGEIFSGFFMGFVIVLLAVYIHIYDSSFLWIGLEKGILNIEIDIREFVYLFLFSYPAVIGIANIMLANNICDIEDDRENKRYTLPIYLGRKRSLTVFKLSYYSIYLIFLLMLILRVSPITALLTFLTIIAVTKNIKSFLAEQSKKDTFVLAVKSFVLINLVHLLSFGLAVVFAYI